MLNVCVHVQIFTVPEEQIVLNVVQCIITTVSKTNIHVYCYHCSLVDPPCVLAINVLATHTCKKYVIKYVLVCMCTL